MSAAFPFLASLAGLIALVIGASVSRAQLTARPVVALHRRGKRLD